MEVKVLQDILSANDGIARRNQNLLDEHGILTINIMLFPGAGKTNRILQTISRLKQKAGISVIEGDVASSVDADKVHEQGVAAILLTWLMWKPVRKPEFWLSIKQVQIRNPLPSMPSA